MGLSKIHWNISSPFAIALLVASQLLLPSLCEARLPADTEHASTKDFHVVEDAFLHGYTHNEVTDVVDGQVYPTLAIQCTDNFVHQQQDEQPIRQGSSVWTRDLYWGYLGWSQEGDDHTLVRMQSSIGLLLNCMHRNKADGKNKTWPLNDGRNYIPQAFAGGGVVAQDFFPFCSESQADFLLLVHQYWLLTGDDAYVRRIWPDILYVTESIEKMDSDGNALPDQLWGTYDYQEIGRDTEEPLMSAKAALAYRAVATMARRMGQSETAARLEKLAESVCVRMDKPIEDGGLWKRLPDGGGFFVNHRGNIKQAGGTVDDRFIPYENLVPIFCGVTSEAQAKAIFTQLDQRFDQIYSLKWGPMFTVPAHKNPRQVIECASTPWLGFLDVYLRCKLGFATNRSAIFKLLIDHAYDVPAAPFAEGAGRGGGLTGGAGRAWDNGNFFHCLINGVYGVEKNATGLTINPPVKMADFPLTELKNVRWRDAVYDLEWKGEGSKIKRVILDGQSVPEIRSGHYQIAQKIGTHVVVIEMF